MSFQPVTFLDTWALSASLRSKVGLFETSGVFIVRGADGEWAAEVREWNSLRNAIKRTIAAMPKFEAEPDIYLERLNPGEVSPWSNQIGGLIETQVAIVTNPQCFVFCGVVCQHLPIGAVIGMGRGLSCCGVNWGSTPRYHLIMTWKQESKHEAE